MTAVVVGVASALTLALVLARRRWFVVCIAGNSMSPTYADGERVLFRRGGFRVTDCVAFVPPYADASGPEWLIKRVVAGAGDPLPAAFRDATGGTEAVVPPGCLVVFGDNRESFDSRQFGYLPAANVVGVAARPRR